MTRNKYARRPVWIRRRKNWFKVFQRHIDRVALAGWLADAAPFTYYYFRLLTQLYVCKVIYGSERSDIFSHGGVGCVQIKVRCKIATSVSL